jgi:MFS family permease
LAWGWRVPFLLSAALVAIALYVRMNIGETPVFAAQRAISTPPRAPVAEVIRRQPGHVLLAAASFVAVFGFVFMAGTYLATYGHNQLGLSRNIILFAGILGGLAWTAVIPLSAAMCDRFGRRPVILAGWALGLPWSLAIIPLIETGNAASFTVAIMGIYATAALAYAPMTSFVPELFPTRYRYSGAGLAINLAGIVGGAVPPLIADPLVHRYGGWAIGLMMAILVVVSLVSTYLLPETKGTSLDEAESHPATTRSL